MPIQPQYKDVSTGLPRAKVVSLSPGDKRVLILMATHHRGSRFLGQQLESVAQQKGCQWRLLVSDDSNNDHAAQTVQNFSQSQVEHRVAYSARHKEGFCSNFFHLLHQATHAPEQYFAFADQDDIWEPEKLEKALNWLHSIPSYVPALYCGRTLVVDAHNAPIGYSPLFSQPPGFRNALVQNIGGGNTMVFNRAALELMAALPPEHTPVSHDWWAYMLVSGADGQVRYDASVSVRYRQHDENLVGANLGWPSRLNRLKALWRGRFRRWSARNTNCLLAVRHLLTPENRKVLDRFLLARDAVLPLRVWRFYRLKLYRQTLLGNLGLCAAVVLKKI